jgi:hypothetical protein
MEVLRMAGDGLAWLTADDSPFRHGYWALFVRGTDPGGIAAGLGGEPGPEEVSDPLEEVDYLRVGSHGEWGFAFAEIPPCTFDSRDAVTMFSPAETVIFFESDLKGALWFIHAAQGAVRCWFEVGSAYFELPPEGAALRGPMVEAGLLTPEGRGAEIDGWRESRDRALRFGERHFGLGLPRRALLDESLPETRVRA